MKFSRKKNKEQPALNNTKTTASLLRMKDISNLDVTLHPGNLCAVVDDAGTHWSYIYNEKKCHY